MAIPPSVTVSLSLTISLCLSILSTYPCFPLPPHPRQAALRSAESKLLKAEAEPDAQRSGFMSFFSASVDTLRERLRTAREGMRAAAVLMFRVSDESHNQHTQISSQFQNQIVFGAYTHKE